jgi:hypothetical protein
MKKAAYIISILVFLCIVAFLLIRFNLPSLSAYALGRILNGTAHVAEARLGYQKGIISLYLQNIHIKGGIEGSIKDWKISMDATQGIYFKSVAISDFDVKISRLKEGKGFLPFPTELFEVKNGRVAYNKQRFSISEIVIEKMNIGKPFTFRADIGPSDYFDRMNISGEGTYRSKQFDIKGTVNAHKFDLAKLDGNPKGKVDGSGTFTIQNKRLTLNGQFGVKDFELYDQYLKKPVYVQELKGDVSATIAGNAMEIKTENVIYRDAPFTVTLKFERYDINEVDLSSGFLSVETFKENIGSEAIGTDLWDLVHSGRAKIQKLSWTRGKSTYAELDMKDLAITYKTVDFRGIEGLLSLREQTTNFSNMSGSAGSSKLYDFNGTIAKNGDITAKGKYSVNLRDIPSFLSVGDLQFTNGTTDGLLEVSGKEGSGYRISGAGKLKEADVRWKKASVSASGSYRFVDDEITFEPLIISKGNTNITIKGKWKKGSLGLLIKGGLDTEHLKPFIKIPFDTSGLMDLDMNLRLEDGVMNVSGSADMNDVYFELLGYMKKERGIPNKARFEVAAKGKDIYVHDLRYVLDNIDLDLKGKIEGNRKISMDVALNVDNVAKIAHLFFFDEKTAKGDITLKMSIRDLSLPLKEFPHMVGHARVRNGFLRLPWLKRPLRNIDLTSDFKGDAFDIVLNSFACGKSAIRKGEFHVKGRQAPQFSLSVDIDHFNPRDFRDEYEGKIPVIRKDSIVANMTGDISIKAKTVEGSDIKTEDLEVSGVLSDRKISIARLRANAFGGQIDVHGIADLSGDKPHIYVNGRLNRIQSGLFLQSFGAKKEEIEGGSFIYGDISGTGDTLKALISKADGNITLYSRNGVIKRWNLLAKTFGILNIYDLLKGKVDFAKEGLAYNKMGANFIVTDGVFQTDNFLIDSPSMVVTGKGNMNFNTREIDGSMQIAPLVTLDRTIDKIPILRNILKRRGGGFLYMACSVSGPIDDPVVRVSFTDTIGTKTLEILRNMLFLPVEVFD